MAANQLTLDQQVQVQIDRMIAEDDQRHSPEEIERLARDVVGRYDGAPVQDYVPNLVYNEVMTKLVEDQQ
jgi:hypothetical protein